MTISVEKRIEILADHYKDSCGYVKDQIKQREFLFTLIVVTIVVQYLEIIFPLDMIEVFHGYLEYVSKVGITVSYKFINSVLWFALFSLSLKYYQVTISIDKQYSFLHSLETKLNDLTKDPSFFTREGNAYLNNYPIFSEWAHFIYTWLFPLCLISVSTVKIFLDFPGVDLVNSINIIFYLLTFSTTILYLASKHFAK